MKADISIYDIILHGIFAAMGGVVRELTTDEIKNFVNFISGAMIGIFTGMVVYFLCKAYGVSEYMTVALTGLSGYSGAPTLDLLTKVFSKLALLKIGDTNDIPKRPPVETEKN